MNLTDSASKILEEQGFTFVALNERGEVIYSSKEMGIAPIKNCILENGKAYLKGAVIADRVVGKAAAMLIAYAEVAVIGTEIISEHALSFLQNFNEGQSDDNKIEIGYKKLVPYIINRKKDGMCPMEQKVLEINDVEKAYDILTLGI